MADKKTMAGSGSDEDKGVRPSSSRLLGSSDSQQQASDGYRAVDGHKRNKEMASAAIESAADFFEQFGFIIEVTPDDAGRVVFGDNRITIELTPKEVEEADAAEETAAATHPFQLSNATTGGVAKVKIRFGMVNAITPTGMDPVDGQTLTVGSSGYVVLAVTTNTSGVATSAVISIAASVPADTSTLGHIALGYATKNTGPTSVTCSQSVAGSLWHQQCGATTHLFGSV